MRCKSEIRILFLIAVIATGLAVQKVERAEVTDCMMCRTQAVL